MDRYASPRPHHRSAPRSHSRVRPNPARTRTLPPTLEFVFQTLVQSSTSDDTQSTPRVGAKAADNDPTLNNTIMTLNPSEYGEPALSYSWSTRLDEAGHPTTLFMRDRHAVARVVWMGGQLKELARSVSNGGRVQRIARSAASPLNTLTTTRRSTLKMGDQPTIALDEFLMRCGTFTKRRSRKFASNSQLFTWFDEADSDLLLVAGDSANSEHIAVLDEKTSILRVGALGMRMLHLDILIVTAVIMLHRRWERSQRR